MSVEIQSLAIVKMDWFAAYKEACTKSELLQNSWTPAIGDWFERHYRMDLSPIMVREERVVEIIHFKSSAQGYWHVTSADGTPTVWNSEVEIIKKTGKWIPRLDQLLNQPVDKLKSSLGHVEFLSLSLGHMHFQALDTYLMHLESLVPIEESYRPA